MPRRWIHDDEYTGVRGGGRGGGGVLNQPYSWLIDCPLDHEYAVMIDDTADTLARYLLENDDPERAAWAAHVAIQAGDESDAPLLNLLRAADARGDHAEANEYLRRIMANHDAEVEEDLPPDTYDLIRRRGWPQAG